MNIDVVTLAAGLIEKMGVIGLLLLIVIALSWWLWHRTIPREAYDVLQQRVDEQQGELQELRYECKEMVGPSLTRMAAIQQRQLELMQDTLKHVNELEERFDSQYRLDAPRGNPRGRRED
jgi:hypothetical protein